jgi:septal ring factor EnvC (AmiA/AmiB activator)
MEETAVDLFKQTVQKDIEDLKTYDKELKEELDKLKQTVAFHERDIKDIKNALAEIKEDTKWLRRSITNAIIVATIGGLVTLIITALRMSQGG